MRIVTLTLILSLLWVISVFAVTQDLAFITNQNSDNVSVINISNNRVITTPPFLSVYPLIRSSFTWAIALAAASQL